MKRILALALALVLVALSIAGCSKPATQNGGTETPAVENGGTETPSTSDGFEIALITDKGNIDDKSFNQGAWEGVVAFAEAEGITHQYIKPEEASDAGYLSAIDLAVLGTTPDITALAMSLLISKVSMFMASFVVFIFTPSSSLSVFSRSPFNAAPVISMPFALILPTESAI